MAPDLHTLRMMFALITFLLFALVMTVQRGRPASSYSRWWALAMLMFCGSALTYLLEDAGYPALALPGGRFLLVAGTQCFAASFYSLTRTVQRWKLIPLPVIVCVTTAAGDPAADRWAGGAVFFGAMAIVMGFTASLLWSLPIGYRKLQTPMAIAVTIMVIYYGTRLIVFVTSGSQTTVFMTLLGPATSAILLILLVVVSTFSMTVQSSEIDAHSLRTRATHDGLTGLLNRQGFNDVAQPEVNRLHRNGMSGALVVMDLDHFKQINDTHGHPGGDRVLGTFAEVTRRRIRSSDLLGRYGGEEFVLLLPGVTPGEAQRITTSIGEACAEASTIDGIPLPTVSFGIAGVDQHGGDLEALVRAADQALYLAKGNGRNQSVVA